MIRLNMVVEGQTEEAFSNRLLVPHLSKQNVFPSVQLISPRTSSNSRAFKGGWNSYSSLRSHLLRWKKSDGSDDVWFTTMLDLYAIPSDFPGLSDATNIVDPIQRVAHLEEQFRLDLESEGMVRFVPYLQLHEFEAILFSNPQHLECEFLDHTDEINRLIAIAGKFNSPEEINSDKLTAPSKRIIQEIPEYAHRKVSAGPLIAEKIGLKTIRDRCSHFNDWLERLEHLQVT